MATRQLPDLSPAEWEVMKAVWSRGEAAARDIFADLSSEQSWAMNTVKTLLSRLVAKGALDYVQVGNSYLYRAAHSRDEMTRREVEDFVERVLDGQGAPALACFLRDTRLSPDEIGRLRALLDEKETQARATGGRR